MSALLELKLFSMWISSVSCDQFVIRLKWDLGGFIEKYCRVGK